MQNQSALFLAVVLLALIASVIRLVMTSPESPERQERGDVTAFMFFILIGSAGSLARDRYSPGTSQFLLINGLLIPICIVTLYFIIRLIRAYKGEQPPSKSHGPRVLKPPKLDPPK